MIDVRFTKLNPEAQAPFRGSDQAAGYDIRSIAAYNIHPGETCKVSTGLAVELPEGTFGGIFARSGLATKQGLRPANCTGVVDSDYRGEIIVALHNDSDKIQYIEAGDRIAQLLILPYVVVNFVEAEDLSDTERGAGGFNSTGVK